MIFLFCGFFLRHTADRWLVTSDNQHASLLPEAMIWSFHPFKRTTSKMTLKTFWFIFWFHFLVSVCFNNFTILLTKGTNLLPHGETQDFNDSYSGVPLSFALYSTHTYSVLDVFFDNHYLIFSSGQNYSPQVKTFSQYVVCGNIEPQRLWLYVLLTIRWFCSIFFCLQQK